MPDRAAGPERPGRHTVPYIKVFIMNINPSYIPVLSLLIGFKFRINLENQITPDSLILQLLNG
jgi:hypothetical protein